jgi:hypothetical protein
VRVGWDHTDGTLSSEPCAGSVGCASDTSRRRAIPNRSSGVSEPTGDG